MKKKFFLIIILINFTNFFSLNPQDRTEKSDTDKYNISLDGVFFFNYENRDRSLSGKDDITGSDKESTGFSVSRAYLNIRGKVNEGIYKGFSFRLTTDIASFGKKGDGCSNDVCKLSNPYTTFLKYAYINIPILNREDTLIRIGLQHDPTINAQSKISLQETTWGHRYVAKTTWEEVGISPSFDRGISIIHNSTYFAGHILLANGEGGYRNNAEGLKNTFLNLNTAVENLSVGVNDSYGYSLSGLISIIPTGNNTTHNLSINFPFRFENLFGVSVNEVQFFAIDLCGSQVPLPPNIIVTAPNAPPTICQYSQSNIPDFSYIRGTKRAKQDVNYGAEVDYLFKSKIFELTIGLGSIIKIDKRGEAIRLTRGLLYGQQPSIKASEITSYYQYQTDTLGNANYVLIHFRWLDFGAFIRYTVGTGDKILGKLGTKPSKSIYQQLIEIDYSNNIIGDVDYYDLIRLDYGKAEFNNIIFGITYNILSEFKVSFGVSQTTGKDGFGRSKKENFLERIPALSGSSASGNNFSEQLQSQELFYSNTSFYNSLGYYTPGKFVTNDWIGKKLIEKQIFIRAQFVFGTTEKISDRN